MAQTQIVRVEVEKFTPTLIIFWLSEAKGSSYFLSSICCNASVADLFNFQLDNIIKLFSLDKQVYTSGRSMIFSLNVDSEKI